MENLDLDFTTTEWNTEKDFISLKKKLHRMADDIIKMGNENGFDAKGVSISLSSLDGGELDAYVFGVQIMKTYTKWLIKFSLSSSPGIRMTMSDNEVIQHVKIWNTETGEILLNGFAEDIIDKARENESQWILMMEEEIKNGVRLHEVEEYFVYLNPDMNNLNSGTIAETNKI